jgi:NAD(P)-dependent dehydrogenase (short-subunit alcohol dehydrogenase family)
VVEQAVKQFGGLHIAVNNAGIGGPLKAVGEYPIDGWDKTIAINLSGVFYGMRYQIPAMLSSGGGSIVNVASILGKVGTKNSVLGLPRQQLWNMPTKISVLIQLDQDIS